MEPYRSPRQSETFSSVVISPREDRPRVDEHDFSGLRARLGALARARRSQGVYLRFFSNAACCSGVASV